MFLLSCCHCSPAKGTSKWSGLEGLHERTQGSLIEQTLREMASSEEFARTAADLKRLGQKRLTLKEKRARRRALDNLGVPGFHAFLQQQGVAITRVPADTLQLNIGLYCNQACVHCHVESSPKRCACRYVQAVIRFSGPVFPYCPPLVALLTPLVPLLLSFLSLVPALFSISLRFLFLDFPASAIPNSKDVPMPSPFPHAHTFFSRHPPCHMVADDHRVVIMRLLRLAVLQQGDDV